MIFQFSSANIGSCTLLIDKSNTHPWASNLTTLISIDEEVKRLVMELYYNRCALLAYTYKFKAKLT